MFILRTEEFNRVTEVERKRVPQWLAAISEADNELGKLQKRFEGLKTEERMALNEQDRLRKDLYGLYEVGASPFQRNFSVCSNWTLLWSISWPTRPNCNRSGTSSSS